MANLAKILAEKTGDVIRIDGDATVFEAVKAMVDANVGAILVSGAHAGQISGIFTERDYLRRIAVEGRTSRDTKVRDVMSSPVIAVTPETTVEEAMALMTDRRIRHAPVVQGDELLGMISIGDLVRAQSHEQSFKIQYLTEYISAR
jgi:CBS domain-containing protein